MNNRIAILLSGVAAVLTLNASTSATSATPSESMQSQNVQSYAELLKPIPNAVHLLQADDARLLQKSAADIRLARYHHHHHHHHHHHGYFGRGIVSPYYYGGGPYNCYWVRGRPYWNGWRWIRRPIRVCD